MPSALTTPPSSEIARSVAWMPGSRLLIVTPVRRHLPRGARHIAGQPGARGVRQAQRGIGALTDCEVMLTTRPQPRAIIPGSTACISAIGRQHVGVERLDEILALPVRPQARRRPARVGHQDVERAGTPPAPPPARLGRDVGRDRRHLHPVRARGSRPPSPPAPRPRARSAPGQPPPPPAPRRSRAPAPWTTRRPARACP